ncbi:hypothetical protein HN924_03370 [Candidatus Woesearchaeota archaeon]|jgi:hypothetical protein|nr:hypothetical protein [Candidatus Woesearchaeota archaeon]MBT7062982.1 hypothetical protein [Candidatus Woesearchaeota archaeon]MBT7402799.1 hypothetical protein [Candidatus Woesearchaeota archaeon]
MIKRDVQDSNMRKMVDYFTSTIETAESLPSFVYGLQSKAEELGITFDRNMLEGIVFHTVGKEISPLHAAQVTAMTSILCPYLKGAAR